MKNTLNSFEKFVLTTFAQTQIKGGSNSDNTPENALIVTEDIMDG